MISHAERCASESARIASEQSDDNSDAEKLGLLMAEMDYRVETTMPPLAGGPELSQPLQDLHKFEAEVAV